MEKYPVDVDRPELVLRNAFRRFKLDVDKLIWYAYQYVNDKILKKVIEITMGDNEYELA
jgi:hypothetical protein